MLFNYGENKNKLLLVSLILTISFIVFIHLYLLIPGTDAGIFMYGSMLITKGFSPYIYLWDDKPPLIYLIGCVGFLLKTNPFLGIRIFELIIFFVNLFLIKKICKAIGLKNVLACQLAYCALYLIFWDQGFLTETFNIPLVLLVTYLFIKRYKYLDFVLPLCLLLSFLLKQNSIAVLGMIAVVDIFTNYRNNKWPLKALKYIVAIAAYSCIAYFILNSTGVWNDFIDQAFVYNFRYIHQHSILELLVRHVRQGGPVSILGLAFVLTFHLVLVTLLIGYFFELKNGKKLDLANKFIFFSIIIYLLALYPTYLSGRSYPHYFLMLIVPASFILSRIAGISAYGRFLLIALVLVALISNINKALANGPLNSSRRTIVNLIKSNTTESDRIYVEGMSDAWIYMYSNRLSCTKFIYAVPFYESSDYSDRYKNIFQNDLQNKKPALIVVDKEEHCAVDRNNFYFQTVDKALTNYNSIYEDQSYGVYKLNMKGHNE